MTQKPKETWLSTCGGPKEYPNLRLRMSGNLTECLLGVGIGPLSEILAINDT